MSDPERHLVDEPFSDQLERWLESDEPKTLGRLGDVFTEKAYAVAVLLLMITPALPLPTGGITHVFEAVAVLLGAEMVVGAKTIWLPSRWRERELGRTARKALPVMMRRIRSPERISRRRGAHLARCSSRSRSGRRSRHRSPGSTRSPQSGPSAHRRRTILEDVFTLAIGVAIGVGGVVLIFTLGAAVFRLIKGLV